MSETPVPMTMEELESEALKLDPVSRAKLVESLTRSLRDVSENESERLWIQEAMKRSRELREAQPAAPPGSLPLLAGEGRGEGQPRPARKKPPSRPTRRARSAASRARAKRTKPARRVRPRAKRAKPARPARRSPRRRPRARR